MPNYADVHTKIWNDPKFRAYSPYGKLVFLNAWTNDSANLCCIYEYDKELAQFQIGINGQNYESAFEETLASKAIKYDPETRKIWVVNRFKYRPKSPAVITGVITELNLINDHPFVKEFIEKYKIYLLPYIDRLHTVYRPSLDRQIDRQIDNKDLLTYLSTENLRNLKNLFKTEEGVKRHLLGLGIPEHQIDEAFGRKRLSLDT